MRANWATFGDIWEHVQSGEQVENDLSDLFCDLGGCKIHGIWEANLYVLGLSPRAHPCTRLCAMHVMYSLFSKKLLTVTGGRPAPVLVVNSLPAISWLNWCLCLIASVQCPKWISTHWNRWGTIIHIAQLAMFAARQPSCEAEYCFYGHLSVCIFICRAITISSWLETGVIWYNGSESRWPYKLLDFRHT